MEYWSVGVLVGRLFVLLFCITPSLHFFDSVSCLLFFVFSFIILGTFGILASDL